MIGQPKVTVTMSDQARARLPASTTPQEVADTLSRLHGQDVRCEALAPSRGSPDVSMLYVGAAHLQREIYGFVGAGPDTDGEVEVTVYGCDPSRDMIRALAEAHGGRHRGSDYDDAWVETASPAP